MEAKVDEALGDVIDDRARPLLDRGIEQAGRRGQLLQLPLKVFVRMTDDSHARAKLEEERGKVKTGETTACRAVAPRRRNDSDSQSDDVAPFPELQDTGIETKEFHATV